MWHQEYQYPVLRSPRPVDTPAKPAAHKRSISTKAPSGKPQRATMDALGTPPAIPVRNRQYGGPRSLPGPSTPSRSNDINRVHVQAASPEVISSLITSLSIISSPVNAHFEHSDKLPMSPAAAHSSFSATDRYAYQNETKSGGSFGIDYGAFNRPSLQDTREEGSLDELAASPPVIRTAKPPSGFSPLTAPKSANKDATSLKTFLRNPRPTSKDSNGSKDREDVVSIGGVSIEPGIAPPRELSRQSSSDSWGKKQGRNQKGLMYMSSKERLRESTRKTAAVGANGAPVKVLGIDRPPLPKIESESFLAETPINEEAALEQQDYFQSDSQTASAAESPSVRAVSPSLGSSSPGGIGSGRYIPMRDSSLRKESSNAKKRSSHRTSRQSGKQDKANEADETIKEADEQGTVKRDRSSEKRKQERLNLIADVTSKLQQPLDSSPVMQPSLTTEVASKQVEESARVDQKKIVDDEEEGAPSPAVAQRKARAAPDQVEVMSSQARKSGRQTPESLEKFTKNDNSKIKRLSAPMSPTKSEKERHQRSASQPLSRKDMTSPEPKAPRPSVDGRPKSADSVDDAVDAYLCSPRLSQKIRHPQTGRTISFSEVGDSEGFAVFCCVGMGLTRYITAFYDELALTLKLRLITPDRPGVGDSEPYTDGTATPLSWPDDVYAICQTLKITKFSILAHSAGAIYALATALRMPQHIRGRIHLLAPWIPPSQLSVSGAKQLLPPTNSIPTSQRILRALPTPILKAANSSFMSATSTSITSSLPKSPRRSKRKSTPGRETPTPTVRSAMGNGTDKENLGPNSSKDHKPSESSPLDRAANDPMDPNSEAAVLSAAASSRANKERQMTYDTRLTHAIWDLATSGANPAVDLLVCLERRHTIGFRYVDITRAIVIHHGSKDTRVPVENVKWLGKTMRRCEVRVLEGEGHGLMASAVVMGSVLMEIAKEWEDWMRVVEQKPAARTLLRERASVNAFR